MTDMSRDLETLAMELYEARTEPSVVIEHGIIIDVATEHPQLIMPTYLKRQHRPAIRLVLQHTWNGLRLDEGGFMVTLSFNRTPTKVYIPWEAILGWRWQTEKPQPKPTLAEYLQGTEIKL